MTTNDAAQRLLDLIHGRVVEVETCYRCDGPIDHNSHHGNEFDLTVTFGAGYMGFRDDLMADPMRAELCHNCAADFHRFMGFDPATMKDMRGLHPDRNDGEPGTPMCCEYAWRALPGFGDPNHDGPITEHGYETNKKKEGRDGSV